MRLEVAIFLRHYVEELIRRVDAIFRFIMETQIIISHSNYNTFNLEHRILNTSNTYTLRILSQNSYTAQETIIHC